MCCLSKEHKYSWLTIICTCIRVYAIDFLIRYSVLFFKVLIACVAGCGIAQGSAPVALSHLADIHVRRLALSSCIINSEGGISLCGETCMPSARIERANGVGLRLLHHPETDTYTYSHTLHKHSPLYVFVLLTWKVRQV